MSNSEYSRLLTKMAELKSLTAEYKDITGKYKPATAGTPLGTPNQETGNTDRYTLKKDINAMSSTATPLVVRPGEDYKEYWKYVGKVDSGTSNDLNSKSQECWNMAARDPRLFKAVVYTGNSDALSSNPGQSEWNNRCYGLMWDATGADVSYNTKSTGYSTMVGPGTGTDANGGTNGIYTKLGITDGNGPTANIAAASKLYDIELRVNSLVQEIAAVSDSGINKELKDLIGSATDAKTLIEKINQYMNGNVDEIAKNYELSDKRKELNNVYSEINGQTTLRARKYRFIFYIVIAISIIIGYASYTSKLPLIDQIDALKNYIPLGWWTNWWIITIVVIVFILSSFGWDMKGNILMVIRYVSDPEFWTGQLWWVGVTFFLLVIIFFYASFKSFFVEFDAGMKGIQEGLDGE
jgi:hypothetical protein